MLNKPTGVSPYNEFIDINKGLELNFTLNNTVDSLSVDIYKYDDSFIGGEAIHNSNKTREFSYSVPEELLANMSNGENYYWKTQYWKTPSEENKKGDFVLNYLDGDRGLLGVFPPRVSSVDTEDDDGNSVTYECRFGGIKEYDEDTGEFVTRIPYLGNTWDGHHQVRLIVSQLNSNIDNNNKKYYLCFVDSESCVGYGRIKRFSSSYEGTSFAGNEICFVLDDMNLLPEETVDKTLVIIDLTSEDFAVGEYVSVHFDGVQKLCKINSINILSENCIPTIGLFVSNGFSHPSWWSNQIVNITEPTLFLYDKADYNESPLYSFYCREFPTITFKEIENNCPQTNIIPNISGLDDVGYYSYKIYKSKDNQNWNLLWESPKYTSMYEKDDRTYDLESVTYRGVTPNQFYKIVVMGQTSDGMEYREETSVSTVPSPSTFNPITTSKNFVSFNNKLGCIEVDNSLFSANLSNTELQVYRYDVEKDSMEFVASTKYDVDTTGSDENFIKRTKFYDFNITNEGRYRYYAFLFNDDVDYCCYISDDITPRWNGLYVTDLDCVDNDQYKPNLNESWFIYLNYSPSEVSHNYQVGRPLGINQKYPKAIRGNSDYKTGSVSGLLGGVSCETGNYIESRFDIDKFERFCNSGNLKLLRSSARGRDMIVDLDNMSFSEFAKSATTVKFSYTQIDDIEYKRINVER